MNGGKVAKGLKVKYSVGHCFDLCHIYRQSVGRGQIASICASLPFPQCYTNDKC